MRSYVVTITKGTKEKNQIKTKIRVGSVVKANFGELDENKRKGINRRIIKEVVVCVQDLVWKKIFLVKFEYG